jgi:hypothetical protein
MPVHVGKRSGAVHPIPRDAARFSAQKLAWPGGEGPVTSKERSGAAAGLNALVKVGAAAIDRRAKFKCQPPGYFPVKYRGRADSPETSSASVLTNTEGWVARDRARLVR